jgi:hypothetical protein
MKKVCSVMQPTFLPWIGYFDLITQVDTFVLYDDVQFAKQSWQTRNRIPTANGITQLTVPLHHSPLDTLIFDIEIDNRKPWAKKHLKSIFYNYQKAPFFKEIYGFMEDFFQNDFEMLADMHAHFIRTVAQKIGIYTSIVKSSELRVNKSNRVQRLIDICKKVDAEVYISTAGASDYMQEEDGNYQFNANHIQLLYHNYQHPVYPTLFHKFTPYMCILDLLFMVGFEGALPIILQGRRSSKKHLEVSQSSG